MAIVIMTILFFYGNGGVIFVDGDDSCVCDSVISVA